MSLTSALGLAATVAAALIANGSAAAPVSIAGVHFFDGTGVLAPFNDEVTSTSGAVSGASSAQGQPVPNGGFTFNVDAEARASIASLGVRLSTGAPVAGQTASGYGSVAASVFEGVRFVSRETPTTGNTLQGYSIALSGTLSATLAQTETLTGRALAPGEAMQGSSDLFLSTFATLEDRGEAIRGTGLGRSFVATRLQTVGSFTVPYVVQPPQPVTPGSGGLVQQVLVINPNLPADDCGLVIPPEVCQVMSPTRIIPRVTSFGLGLSLTARLSAEFGAIGEIDAFNSFTLDGLAMLDPSGNPINGVFFSDSGADLTLDAYRDAEITQALAAAGYIPQVAPIPVPAGLVLLTGALAMLPVAGRRTRRDG